MGKPKGLGNGVDCGDGLRAFAKYLGSDWDCAVVRCHQPADMRHLDVRWATFAGIFKRSKALEDIQYCDGGFIVGLALPDLVSRDCLNTFCLQE